MWVEEQKNGKYKFIERYKEPMTGKYKRVSVVLEKNTRQAYKQAQEALQNLIRKAVTANKTDEITLEELIQKYRAEQIATVKQTTYARNYKVCRSLMRVLGPQTVVGNLTAGYIRQAFLTSGKPASTLNEWLTRLHALLRWGYKNDYIANISYLDKLERYPDTPHRIKIENKFLESSELSTLIGAMTVKKWRDLTEFLALSGLRFGEAAALELSDINLKDRIIHVENNYDSAHDVVTSTKTETSTRDVYMQDQLYQLCRRIKASRFADQTVMPMFTTFFVGSGRRGNVKYDPYAKYLRENSERVLGRRITPHTLRHTHASLLMEQGVSIDSISRRLGHSDSRVTREIYLHVTKKLQERENEQLKEIKIL